MTKVPSPPSRLGGGLSFAAAHRTAVALGLVGISSFLLFLQLLSRQAPGDVALYGRIASYVLQGQLPYRDQPLEYPPYVVPLFLVPRLFGAGNYLRAFCLYTLLADTAIKVILLVCGTRATKGLRGIAPVALYCIAVPVLCHFYLRRYDAWLALICLAAIIWFCRGRYGVAGAAIAVGIGLKVYPIVFVPPLFVLAVRRGQGRLFAWGTLAGILPLLLLGFFLPWWHFAQFQADRGLQCESLYASVIWVGKLLGLWQATWEEAKAWKEVRGALASAVLPFARLLSVSAIIGSMAVASYAAARCRNVTLPQLAQILLVPLLGFIVFNQVFSPQFLVWALPLAALATLGESPLTSVFIMAATVMTPIFYPSIHHNYGNSGLDLFEASALMLRNFMLVGVWVALLRQSISPPLPLEANER